MNKITMAQPAKTSGFFLPMQGILQRKCACGNQTVAGGECAECAKKKSSLQRKLTIGASNDPLEQEADRVADQVMAMPLNSGVNHTVSRIQRFAGQASDGLTTAPSSVDRVLASSGRTLEPTLRQDMEQRFGHDFSQVRVHTGGAAEQSARDINAQAYTVGNDVVFGAGLFAPQSIAGKRLIAHELTHVAQQSEISAFIQRQTNDLEQVSDLSEVNDTMDNPEMLQSKQSKSTVLLKKQVIKNSSIQWVSPPPGFRVRSGQVIVTSMLSYKGKSVDCLMDSYSVALRGTTNAGQQFYEKYEYSVGTSVSSVFDVPAGQYQIEVAPFSKNGNAPCSDYPFWLEIEAFWRI